MNRFKELDKYSKIVFLLIGMLLIPAFFGNIGLMPYRTDEPTRLNVAMEMALSGNYITPRINGEFYYNKPPLYNWILIATDKVLPGFFNEFAMRVPTVLFLMLFSLAIWRFTYRKIGNYAALAVALAFMTGGRILFWDSYQALIDIPFSLVIFLNFFVLMKIPEAKNKLALFATSYLLIGLAFLFKGFPAVVFQALSLPTVFIFHKKWKLMFNWRHFLGSVTFIGIVGLYFWAYAHYNKVETLTSTLFEQSANRTAASEYITIKDTILHLFTFPFEMIYHFLPWSLILIVFFTKNAWSKIKEKRFLAILLLLFIINIPIYWISVDVKPRYLFMFSPLLMIVGFGVLEHLKENNDRIYKILMGIFKYLAISCAIFTIAAPYAFTGKINMINITTGIIAASLCGVMVYAMIRQPRLLIFSFIGILMVIRILFNFFELPSRYEKSNDVIFRNYAYNAAELSGKNPVYVWSDCTVNHEFTCYFTKAKKQVLRRWKKKSEVGGYYLLDNYKWVYFNTLKNEKYILIKKCPSRMGDIYMVKRVM